MLSIGTNEVVKIAMVLLAFGATAALIAVAVTQSTSPQPTTPLYNITSADTCPEPATRLYLPDGPYDNRFFSDCHSSAHVILTSPRAGDNLTIIKPRLLIAWPAGNSGALAVFEPENGVPGSLSMRLENSSNTREVLDPIYEPVQGGNPIVGVSGSISFNDSAILAAPVLGSVRAIRDFVEGGRIDHIFQNRFGFAEYEDGSASINRTWFDGVTTTTLKFTPLGGAKNITINRGANWTLSFGPGIYRFEASFNYPQLEQLGPQEVLNPASQGLIAQNPDQTTSLSFLSYEGKLLAGTWRFLTYFGRDSMISMLLLQPVLSQEAIESVIGAVLERVNRSDGTVCHEEVLGDYASYLNLYMGIISSQPECDYKMVDTDFMLPITMQRYFVDTEPGKNRSGAFFNRTASFLVQNNGLKYSQLAQITAEKIMQLTAPFAKRQIKENLIHLRPNQPVGEWRDSNNGLGGGRVPYNVNAALAPAGLRAIAALSRAGFFPDHPDWAELADQYAKIWEDQTLQFFRITVPQAQARVLVQNYVSTQRLSIPSEVSKITADVEYFGVSLNGTVGNGGPVPVMNTDDCFRHFFLNTTDQAQLSAFMNQSADHILKPFPVGLSTDVGLVVANPAYSDNVSFARNFSQTDYHGTVVWSWQLAMMGAGLGRQLGRCEGNDKPDFCSDSALYQKVLSAYNALWDTIEANRDLLSGEVWSWRYNGKYEAVPLGAITSTESNIRQLWSLTFLAVHREKFGGRGTKGVSSALKKKPPMSRGRLMLE